MEQMLKTMKKEGEAVEAAASSAAHSDTESDSNFSKPDSGLVQSVKREVSFTTDALVKEEILEDASQDDSEQQCAHAASTSAGTGRVNEACSTYQADLFNVKYESAEIDIGPTVVQPMDIHYTTNKATGKQLSRLWLNIKSKQRSQLTRERQHRMATGGGGAVSDVEIDPLVSLISPGLIVEIPSNDSARQFNLDPSEQQSTSCSDIRPSDETALDASQPEAILAEDNAPTASTSIPMRRTNSQYSGETRLSFGQRQLLQTEQVKRSCIQHEMAQRQRREDELHELRKDILLSQSREAKARALLAELEVEIKNPNLKYIYLL